MALSLNPQALGSHIYQVAKAIILSAHTILWEFSRVPLKDLLDAEINLGLEWHAVPEIPSA